MERDPFLMSLLCFAARTSIDDETEEAGCHEEPFYKDGEPLGHEHIVIPLEVDDQDKERQAVHEVILDAGREAWNDIVQYFVFSPCIIHRAFNV